MCLILYRIKNPPRLRGNELNNCLRVLYIDGGGTTSQKIVEALPPDFTATVVTNAIPIAAKPCEFPNVEAIMLGAA